jgi:hypothetical protein
MGCVAPGGGGEANGLINYRGADKSLARPGKKQGAATVDFEFHTYILFMIIIGGILVLFIYIKTNNKRNILIIKQNTSGSRSG